MRNAIPTLEKIFSTHRIPVTMKFDNGHPFKRDKVIVKTKTKTKKQGYTTSIRSKTNTIAENMDHLLLQVEMERKLHGKYLSLEE